MDIFSALEIFEDTALTLHKCRKLASMNILITKLSLKFIDIFFPVKVIHVGVSYILCLFKMFS